MVQCADIVQQADRSAGDQLIGRRQRHLAGRLSHRMSGKAERIAQQFEGGRFLFHTHAWRQGGNGRRNGRPFRRWIETKLAAHRQRSFDHVALAATNCDAGRQLRSSWGLSAPDG